MPDAARRERIALMVKKLRKEFPATDNVALADVRLVTDRLRRELRSATTDAARTALHKQVTDLLRFYPDSPVLWDIRGETESAMGEPFKGFVNKEVAAEFDSDADGVRQVFLQDFLLVLTKEREVRLQRTLAEVDQMLQVARDPKCGDQDRKNQLAAARLKLMQKLRNEDPGDPRLTRRLTEIADIKPGAKEGF